MRSAGDALLEAVLREPGDDTPRLVYADWLDEHGRPERAEFVRVQVELARTPEPEIKTAGHVANQPDGFCAACRKTSPGRCQYHALERRERELRDLRHPERPNEHLADSWFFAGRVVTHGSEGPIWWYPPAPDGATGYDITLSRGFVSGITLDADAWLRHADALYWHPEQTEKCWRCEGHSVREPKRPGWGHCPDCDSAGRVPRPFPATAQPIERVTFSALGSDAMVGWVGDNLYRRRDDPDVWECDRWPGVVFFLPSAPPSFPPGSLTFDGATDHGGGGMSYGFTVNPGG